MMDWLKATAAAFTAVATLVGLCIAFIYRCGGPVELREDDIQDYVSPDGNYVATVKTASGGHLVAWYCVSVLVHPATVSTEEALKAGKRYLVLGGDCDAIVRWESSKAVEVEILRANYPANYEIAPRDLSRQISINFRM